MGIENKAVLGTRQIFRFASFDNATMCKDFGDSDNATNFRPLTRDIVFYDNVTATTRQCDKFAHFVT